MTQERTTNDASDDWTEHLASVDPGLRCGDASAVLADRYADAVAKTSRRRRLVCAATATIAAALFVTPILLPDREPLRAVARPEPVDVQPPVGRTRPKRDAILSDPTGDRYALAQYRRWVGHQCAVDGGAEVVRRMADPAFGRWLREQTEQYEWRLFSVAMQFPDEPSLASDTTLDQVARWVWQSRGSVGPWLAAYGNEHAGRLSVDERIWQWAFSNTGYERWIDLAGHANDRERVIVRMIQSGIDAGGANHGSSVPPRAWMRLAADDDWLPAIRNAADRFSVGDFERLLSAMEPLLWKNSSVDRDTHIDPMALATVLSHSSSPRIDEAALNLIRGGRHRHLAYLILLHRNTATSRQMLAWCRNQPELAPALRSADFHREYFGRRLVAHAKPGTTEPGGHSRLEHGVAPEYWVWHRVDDEARFGFRKLPQGS